MADFMVKFYENDELSDVICEKCTKSRGTTSKAKFEVKNSTKTTNVTNNLSSKIRL